MKYKAISSLIDVEETSVIRNKVTGEVFIVTANYGDRLTVVRTGDVTNTSEWEVLERGEE